jgi:hypothetical protein
MQASVPGKKRERKGHKSFAADYVPQAIGAALHLCSAFCFSFLLFAIFRFKLTSGLSENPPISLSFIYTE